MALEFNPTIRTASALDLAAGLGDEISTAHLLAGLVTAAPSIARILDAFDVTPTVAVHVVRECDKEWNGPDGVAQPDAEIVLPKALRVTDGAAAALLHATRESPGRECRPETLLLAVLRDDRARATAVLRACGIDPETVRAAAAGGDIPPRTDPVSADLRPIRDRMIGRERFRGNGLRAFLFQKIFKNPYPYAAAPTLWISLESEQIARQRGGARRTDDLLIAMLATYRVATAYPHLTTDNAEGYDGSRELAAAGLDHRRLEEAAATLDLGEDGISVKSLLTRDDWPRTTTDLLARLTAHDDTRSARLLKALRA
ncbi:Clp protease N-terminal domain-containing protein [Actinoplanes sp. CA-252034]|uniref:Clp protease N-terminal domain-containing protein n=1 Tax=Actinoplanes sp. CA-252034 TaxID=3239906 RepID=UPI003D954873